MLKGPAFRRASLRTLQEFLSRQNGVLTFWKGKLRDSGKRNKQKVSGEESAESGEIPEYLPICLELRVFWNFCTPRGYSGLQDRGPTTQG